MHFYIRDPNPTHTKSGLSVGFIFHPWMHLKKTLKIERNLKKLKTQKKPEKTPQKTQNPKKS
jgi:uncharacterized membrane protein YciS (DUF1049 family)